MVCPFTYALSSLKRKATTLATSLGSPKRLVGLRCAYSVSAAWGSAGLTCLKASATIGVKIAPGAIALVIILYLPNSKAVFFVIPVTACLLATYGIWFN